MSKKIFSTGAEEKVLNKCPLCGSKLEYCALYQYSIIYNILNNGKLAKKRKKKRDEGSMECGFISCINEDCNFHTDCDLDVEEHIGIYIYQSGEQFLYETDY